MFCVLIPVLILAKRACSTLNLFRVLIPVQTAPRQQHAIIIGRPPAADHGQQLKWSDFLADDAAAAAAASEAQQVLGQYHHEAGGSSVLAAGSSSAGGGRGCGDGGGGDDGAAAFIDAILDCDKETGVDQLIAELLADPAYYAGSSSSSTTP